MKVAVIYTGAYPSGDAATERVHNMCLGLVESGVDVEVLLANPTESPDHIRNALPTGEHEGVRFAYVGGHTTRSERFWKRRVQDLNGHLRTVMFVAFRRKRYDVAIVIGAKLDFRMLLPLAGRVAGRKVVMEINEYPYVAERSAIFASLKRNLLFRLVFPLYLGFIPISRPLSEEVERHKSPSASKITIPILAGELSLSTDRSSLFDWPYIVHTGSLHEEKDGIFGILEALAITIGRIDTPLRLVVTGRHEGTEQYRAVLQAVKLRGLSERVVFVGYCSREKLSRILQNSFLAIVNKNDTVQNRYCFATKLAGYLLHGVPVITTAVGEQVRYLQDGRSAYLVVPGRPELLAERVIQAINNPEERRRIGTAGKELVETTFNYKVQGARLAHFLANLS